MNKDIVTKLSKNIQKVDDIKFKLKNFKESILNKVNLIN